MKILKPDTVTLLYNTHHHAGLVQGDCQLVLACMACFAFAPHVPELLPQKELWDCAGAHLPAATPLDEGRPKPFAEWLVFGACHAPPGSRETRAREVLVRVSDTHKRLTIFGERCWRHGLHSDPIPFTSMPITWENAFGGINHSANPLGKGACQLNDGTRPLPNVEAQGEYLDDPNEKPLPAGFGAVFPSWPPRLRHAGAYNRKWMQHHWPGHPIDTKPEFYLRTLRDQHLKGFFKGGESFSIQGMHPDKEQVSGSVPALRCRVFVLRSNNDGSFHFEELETRADTLTLFPERERGVLTFRAVTHALDEECEDISVLSVIIEPQSVQPEAAEYYRQSMEEALKPLELETAPLPPIKTIPIAEPEDAGGEPSALQTESAAAPLVDLEALQKRVAHIESKSQDLLKKAGVTEEEAHRFMAGFEQQYQEQERAMFGNPGETAADPFEEMRLLMDGLEVQGRAMLKQSGKSEEEIEELLKQFSGIDEPQDMERHLASQLERTDVPEEIKSSMRGMIESFSQVAMFCASLRNLGEGVASQSAEQVEEPDDSAPPFSRQKMFVRLTRQDVLERRRKGENLAGFDLSGLDLSKLDLSGVNLQGALLQGVSFSQCNLRETDLSGADCFQADFTGACLEGANLSGASLEKAILRNVAAQGLCAIAAQFYEADVTNAIFIKAELEDADFSRAVLDKSDFSNAHAPRIRLLAASLQGADFRNAYLHNSRADSATDATRAVFCNADMTLSGWRGAQLIGADLTGAVLVSADCSACAMNGARLDCVNAEDAKFYKANLEGTRFVAAILNDASLRRARLSGARFTRANLAGADLYKCVFGNTDVEGANLKHTILDPAILAGLPE